MAVQTGSSQELIDGLINTFRELNIKVRSVPDAQTRQASSGGASARDVVRRLRDDELRFSQALKERVTGVPMPDILGEETPIVGTEQSDDTTAVLIAQFGYAREVTLALLRPLEESEWDQEVTGGTTIRARIQELVENDRKQLERILGMLPAQ
ncbi:MAG: hypothetical protein ACRDJH_23150 [Thermomicrobiales bacterium]